LKLYAWLLIGILLTISYANTANLINLGGEFEKFLADTQDQNAVQAEQTWISFEARHQSIYNNEVYNKGTDGWEARQLSKRALYFSKLPVIKERMLELFHNAAPIVAEREAQFRTLFPDLVSDIPVVFLPSVFSFNGQESILEDYGHRPGLLIGVGMIADRNDNIKVLFSHEYFHAYHEAKIVGTSGATMATPLWKEGFATYVSGVLNPTELDETLFMQTDLAQLCAHPQEVKKLAALFRSVLKTDGRNTYADWFLVRGTTQPKRRGYCLGLQIIREVVKTHPVTEMAAWDEARFSAEIEALLNKWSDSLATEL
jgi:hypothetical protein